MKAELFSNYRTQQPAINTRGTASDSGMQAGEDTEPAKPGIERMEGMGIWCVTGDLAAVSPIGWAVCENNLDTGGEWTKKRPSNSLEMG